MGAGQEDGAKTIYLMPKCLGEQQEQREPGGGGAGGWGRGRGAGQEAALLRNGYTASLRSDGPTQEQNN